MSVIAIYPGTFDPITNGHIDILERASDLFEKVIVTVAINSAKTPLFSDAERLDLIQQSIAHIPNAEATMFSGLVVDFAKLSKAKVIIRGLRALSDFEYEFQMALMNRKLAAEVSTVFLMPNEKYTYLNSSLIRQLAQFHADVAEFVPDCVLKALVKKFGEQ